MEGFPPPTELKTVYVEHDIDSEEADTPSLDFVASDPRIEGASREEVEKMLTSVGFSDEYLKKAVGSLSGGWKMKLALARAMLLNADILLLDGEKAGRWACSVAWQRGCLVRHLAARLVAVAGTLEGVRVTLTRGCGAYC